MSDTIGAIGDYVGQVFNTIADPGVSTDTQSEALNYLDAGASTPTDASSAIDAGNGLQGYDGSTGGLDPETQAGAGGMSSATDGISGVDSGNSASWMDGMSLGAKQILGKAIAGGASAMLSGIAQRNQQDFAREMQQNQFDEYNRRHKIGAFSPTAFTPKTGIIAGARA